MNRKERRSMGLSKDVSDRVDRLNDPCSIAEAVQIARGVSEDVLADYKRGSATLQVALSMQVEILRDLCIKSEIFTEETFKSLYESKVAEFNNLQRGLQGEVPVDPKMSASANDVEIKTEE